MASKHRVPLRQGYILEGYRISEVLGGGGFSLVYLARESATDKEMVVKEYSPKALVTRNPDGTVEPVSEKARLGFVQGMKQFFAEASALAKLNHPNIVNVTNIFRANNTVYMVMNYELGRDLRWFIKQCHGQLDQPFMLKVFPPIASGLSKLHENGFLHLDVKPANILLRASGEPLLLDFGAAQTASSGERFRSFQTLTHGFAPAEQYNEGEMGPWSDIYALGAAMYACVTGKSPPPALKRQAQDTLESLTTQYSGQYSYPMLRAIEWALRLNHRERPTSVRVFTDLAFSETTAELEMQEG
ncbi:MAG: serine/threonine protein kinase [Parasphingorhabdus sp.]|jgi:serine/threonine protein kinase